MHRYILFAGDKKNFRGGYEDYIGSRTSVEALKKLAITCKVGGYKQQPDWADVVDITTMGRLWSLRDDKWVENTDAPSNSCGNT